jgi:hypothetical protein
LEKIKGMEDEEEEDRYPFCLCRGFSCYIVSPIQEEEWKGSLFVVEPKTKIKEEINQR